MLMSLLGCIVLFVLVMVVVYKAMYDIVDDDEAYEIIMKALRKNLK
jgi:hypothetical protein